MQGITNLGQRDRPIPVRILIVQKFASILIACIALYACIVILQKDYFRDLQISWRTGPWGNKRHITLHNKKTLLLEVMRKTNSILLQFWCSNKRQFPYNLLYKVASKKSIHSPYSRVGFISTPSIASLVGSLIQCSCCFLHAVNRLCSPAFMQ